MPPAPTFSTSGASTNALSTTVANWFPAFDSSVINATACQNLNASAVMPQDVNHYVLACAISAAPGAGKSRTLSVDNTNGTYGFGSCVVSDAATTCLVSGNTPSATDDSFQRVCFKGTATNTPASALARCTVIVW